MTCGHAIDHTYEMQRLAKEYPSMDWIKCFLNYPVEFKPGEVYCYNSVGTFMLSAIIQKATGEKLIDYLNTRLFIPLQIENAYWTENSQGINYGGWGLYLKTEDLAKVGQLLLQEGKWNGKQLISKGWITEMSKNKLIALRQESILHNLYRPLQIQIGYKAMVIKCGVVVIMLFAQMELWDNIYLYSLTKMQ